MFDFSCNCSVDGYDPPTVYLVHRYKARRSHTCCECQREIKKRETYEQATGRWDGEWSTYKTCLGCLRIRDHLSPDGWMHGGLAEAVEECIGFNYVTGIEVSWMKEEEDAAGGTET